MNETGTPPHSAREEIAEDDALLLSLLANGLLIAAVARRLNLSERTVRRRLRSLCDRLGVETPVQAVVWAVHIGALRTGPSPASAPAPRAYPEQAYR